MTGRPDHENEAWEEFARAHEWPCIAGVAAEAARGPAPEGCRPRFPSRTRHIDDTAILSGEL